MKVKNAILAGILFLSPLTAFAQTPGDEATAILGQMGQIGNQMKALDDTEGKWAKDRETNLTSTDDLLKGAEANAKKADDLLLAKAQAYSAEVDQQKALAASFEPQADAYNAQCGGTGDQAYVNNCNAWKARLQPTHDRINAWKGELETKKASIQTEINNQEAYEKGLAERRAQLSQDTLDWAARKKAYLANRDELGARFNTLRDRLQQLANQYDNCTAEFIHNPANSDELIKHKCGNIQFDGAAVSLDELRKIAPAWRMQ